MHTIRLAGPWTLTPIAHTLLRADGSTEEVDGDLPSAGVVQQPRDWGELLGDFRGRVRYTRRFGQPTGISHERVELVIERVDAWARVTLNDRPVGDMIGATPLRRDITSDLRSRNVLHVEVELPRTDELSPPLERGERRGLPGGLIGEVKLEILDGHSER